MTQEPPERSPGPATSQLPTVEPQTIPSPTATAPPPQTQAAAQTQAVPIQAAAPAPAGPARPAKAVRRPLGTLPALVPGIILAIAAIGVGVVGVHDALVYWTRSGSWDVVSIHGATWTGATIHWVESLTPKLWMTFAGAALALVGTWLVVLALKPRRVRGVAVTSSTYMWVEHSGVGRLAVATAARVPGVRSARGSTGRNSVSVTVEAGSGDSQQLATSVRDAIADTLAPLARAPKITVAVKQPDQPAAPTTGSTT
jgi:hypothetical protein